MTVDEICEMARAAGQTGQSYQDFLHNDKIGDAFGQLSDSDMTDPTTTERVEAAYAQGRQAFRLSGGWVVVWTSAAADYDQFGTEELECTEWNGKRLRKVLVDPDRHDYQRSRYMSGAWCWDEDPRETERKIREKIAAENAELKAKKRTREEGLSWLRSVDESLLGPMQEGDFHDELASRGLDWRDARNEESRRYEERAKRARANEWNRCRATFADGCTIVDPGRDPIKGTNPYTDPSIPASNCAVYRNVRVVPHWDKDKANDVHEARIEGDGGSYAGSLWRVAELLGKDLLRVAKDDEHLPPAAVLGRLKPHRLDDLVRVEVDGRIAWAIRTWLFSSNIVVVDEAGKIVRKKSIVEAATKAIVAKHGY